MGESLKNEKSVRKKNQVLTLLQEKEQKTKVSGVDLFQHIQTLKHIREFTGKTGLIFLTGDASPASVSASNIHYMSLKPKPTELTHESMAVTIKRNVSMHFALFKRITAGCLEPNLSKLPAQPLPLAATLWC